MRPSPDGAIERSRRSRGRKCGADGRTALWAADFAAFPMGKTLRMAEPAFSVCRSYCGTRSVTSPSIADAQGRCAPWNGRIGRVRMKRACGLQYGRAMDIRLRQAVKTRVRLSAARKPHFAGDMEAIDHLAPRRHRRDRFQARVLRALRGNYRAATGSYAELQAVSRSRMSPPPFWGGARAVGFSDWQQPRSGVVRPVPRFIGFEWLLDGLMAGYRAQALD